MTPKQKNATETNPPNFSGSTLFLRVCAVSRGRSCAFRDAESHLVVTPEPSLVVCFYQSSQLKIDQFVNLQLSNSQIYQQLLILSTYCTVLCDSFIYFYSYGNILMSVSPEHTHPEYWTVSSVSTTLCPSAVVPWIARSHWLTSYLSQSLWT